jgi:serine/threonine-protein kinase
MLNKKIGRYEIKEIIGEGAMATVYRAFDPEINRSVACKILKAEHCIDEEYTSRFLRESKAAGALSHSSIVTIYDVGTFEGAPYIMMELIEGNDLGETLIEQQTFTSKETLNIALQLAQALDYAHTAKVVHRDIKPDNIILMSDKTTIKIADFGIARTNDTNELQATRVGAILGTPRYMSPEQALGDEIDGRSDLFSVGVIMYEMLTGKKAFDANSMSTLMLQIAQKQPAPLKTVAPEVPAGLRQIVQKLLQKSPNKRFQTGQELADAIKAELGMFEVQLTEQRKQRLIPLRYKWTISAVAVVSCVLAVSMKLMFVVQSSVMTKQAVEAGSLFAKFIAVQALPLLKQQNWQTLQQTMQNAAGRESFAYLIVTDKEGKIRASSEVSRIDEYYKENENSVWISRTNDVYTTSTSSQGEPSLFHLETPILDGESEIGSIILGISQKQLAELKQVTAIFMLVLGVLVVLLIAVVMFVLGGSVTTPLRALSITMQQLQSGNFDARMSLKRKDELGKVFDVFNEMAASVQHRYSDVKDELIFAETKLAEWRIHAVTHSLPQAAARHKTQDERPNENTDKTIVNMGRSATPPIEN